MPRIPQAPCACRQVADVRQFDLPGSPIHGALDAETVRAYIAHRLRVAGVKSNPFTQAATDLIHEATGGIPRRINQLCDLAMVYAFTNGQRTVIRFTVQQVLDDGTFFGALPVGRTAPEVSLQ